MMKRVISSILVMLLVVFVLAGCAKPASDSETGAAQEPKKSAEQEESAQTQPEKPSDGKKKIGVVIWSTTGNAAIQFIELLKQAIPITGVECEYLASGYNTDGQMRDVENFITKGVDGILICNSSDEVMAKIMDLCEPKGIYVAQTFRNISDPQIKARVDSSPYFVGRTFQDEEGSAYELGMFVASKGYKNVCLATGPHGDKTAEDRIKGLERAFKKTGVNILAIQWDVADGTTGANSTHNFLNTYPECDAIAQLFSDEAIVAAHSIIQNSGRDVMLFAQDTTANSEFDRPALVNGEVIMSGGHFVDSLFSYMMLANAVCGYKLADRPMEGLVLHELFSDPKKAAFYYDHMENGPYLTSYNEEEIKMMFKGTNPNLTAEQLEAFANNWSCADFAKRRGLPITWEEFTWEE